jgi:thiamine biosynthesis lipoprotein
MKRKYILTAVALTVTVLLFTACGKQPGEYKYGETSFKMGTAMTITAYGEGAQEAVKSAFTRIDEIEQLTSLNIDISDLNKINNAAGENYVTVNPDLIKIIKKAIEYSKMSNGAFDITIGPIVKLWGIGTKDASIPSPEEKKDNLPLVGYEKIKINETVLFFISFHPLFKVAILAY